MTNKGHFSHKKCSSFAQKPCWHFGEESEVTKKSKVRTSIESYLMFKAQNNRIRIAKLQVSLTRSYPKRQPFHVNWSSNLYRIAVWRFCVHTCKLDHCFIVTLPIKNRCTSKRGNMVLSHPFL